MACIRNYADKNRADKVMSSLITNCDAPRGGGSGKGAARKMITAKNAREDFVLMHAGASVPGIRDGLDKKHPKVGL